MSHYEPFSPRSVGDAFHRLFETPEVIKEYLYKIVTPEEEELLLFLGKAPKTAAQTAARFALSEKAAGERLHSLYHRANAHKSVANPAAYYAATLYDRLGYFTQYEPALWKSIPPERRRQIDEWYVDAFTERLRNQMDAEGARFHRDDVLPVDQALEAVENMDGGSGTFYVVPCNCRTTANNCEKSLETCISNYRGVNGSWDRGYGRPLSLAEVQKLMRACDREGLMHTVSPTGHICNCDVCCCYEFRAAQKLGSKGRYPRVGYIAAFDAARCISCGRCVKRCYFGAFIKEGAAVRFAPERCWGCGVCAATCPGKAIRITERAPSVNSL